MTLPNDNSPTPEDKERFDRRIAKNGPAALQEVMRLRSILDDVEKACTEGLQSVGLDAEARSNVSLEVMERIKSLISERHFVPEAPKKGRPNGTHSVGK